MEGGKLASRPLQTSAAAGPHLSSIAVRDKLSDKLFLIDSGADLSLLPPTDADRARGAVHDGRPLMAVNGSKVNSYGRKKVTVQLHGYSFDWEFTIADTHCRLLGADFLRAHSLLPNLTNPGLFSATQGYVIPCQRCTDEVNVRIFRAAPSVDEFQQLLAGRTELTTPKFSAKAPAHGVELHIPTEGPPVFAQSRRLSPEKLQAAKREFEALEQMGVIRRSKSPWSSPLHLVPKKDGSYRPCGDFRRLNGVTVPDKYQLPYMADVTNILAGKTIFSKVDLVKGYHQIPVAAADIHKTAVVTPFGLFEWCRTPFGLKNAAQAFQRLMDVVGRDLPFAFIYLDDILVASSSREEHLQHLTILFNTLEESGLIVNPDKCVLGVSELEFLGHRVTAAGLEPLPEKVDAVQAFPLPQTAGELMRFNGMINFYNRFMPHVSLIMKPLFAAVAGKKGKDLVEWDPQTTKAFTDTKSALANATLLHHPEHNADIALTTDASDIGVGAVLEQQVDDHWQPLAFFSRKFSTAESKYSAFDRELLAVHTAIRHFRYFLEGRKFTVYTDHHPLTAAIRKISDPHSPRQQRHLAAIAEFTTDLQHVAGKSNYVADALSREGAVAAEPVHDAEEIYPDWITLAAVSTAVSATSQLATAQAADTELQQLVADNSKFKLMSRGSEPAVWCEISHGQPRPAVPVQLRRQVFQELHSLGHTGVKATVKLVRQRYYWPDLSKQVRQWTRECADCQRSKVIRHTLPPAQQIPMPTRRFEHIHVDVVGPLPASQGFTHLFTIVDRFSRWPEVIPISDTSAGSLCMALLHGWVARHGLPSVISSDRGAQFTSMIWENMSTTLGVKLQPTVAYHPQANGLVERLHRRLKEALRARLVGNNWYQQLPWILLSLRATVKEDLQTSPAELLYGQVLTLPGDYLPATQQPATVPELLQQLRYNTAKTAPTPPRTATQSQSTPARPLPPGTQYVFVRKGGAKAPLSQLYEGPYKVIRSAGAVVTIQLGNRVERVAARRCKAAVIDTSNTPIADPPRRGRPRKTPATATSTAPQSSTSRKSGRTSRPPTRL